MQRCNKIQGHGSPPLPASVLIRYTLSSPIDRNNLLAVRLTDLAAKMAGMVQLSGKYEQLKNKTMERTTEMV